jgi:hypothetical protein
MRADEAGTAEDHAFGHQESPPVVSSLRERADIANGARKPGTTIVDSIVADSLRASPIERPIDPGTTQTGNRRLEVVSSVDRPHGAKRGRELIDPELAAPNFFIVGAAKAGTTSLHAYLSSHPQVFMPTLKEPHYFADFELMPEFDNFLPVIRDQAEYQALFKGSEGYVAVGEASPSYLCDPAAAERIRSAIPAAKIIISLRNPVERAFSHYLMEFNRGAETLPFDRALESDALRREKGWGKSGMYAELSLYSGQVASFLREFGRDRVLVILFEDLIRDTHGTMGEVARFLGIDPAAFPESAIARVHNPFEVSRGPMARALLRMRSIRLWAKRWVPKTVRRHVRDRYLFVAKPKPELDARSRQALAERFEKDVQALESLLGRELPALHRPD